MANDERKKQIIADDLAAARRSGRTYNQMFAEAREKQFKEGQLKEDAYKAGKALELYTPKEVRAVYDADPEYFEKRAKEGMKKGGMAKGKWIQEAIKKPGALRAQLGVKAGKTIPAKKLAAAAKAPGKLGQRARLAQTLKKMK